MSTTSPPRPWYFWASIGSIVAVVLIVASTLLIVGSPFSSNNAAQNSAATEAPQEPVYPTFESPPATEATEEPTASATPSASPSPTKKVPAGGDERGCPTGKSGEVDSSDPHCKQRDREKNFNKHFRDNPAYDCPDGRNDGLGINDQDDFVPCINGALRLELGTRGTVTLYSSTTRTASVEAQVSDKADAPQPGVTGVDWVIRQSKFSTDSHGQFYRLRYFSNPDLRPFGVYFRAGGTGNYQLLETTKYKFYTNTYYQVAVFWNDPEGPNAEAPLPPGFSWGSVEKPASS